MEDTKTFHSSSVEGELMKYKEGVQKFSQSMPELISAYNHFTELCFKEGEIPGKYKQLMGLAISICAQDAYCMIYHTKGCLDQGCTKQEILEAIGVAAGIGGGAAVSRGVTFVQNCLEQFQQHKH